MYTLDEIIPELADELMAYGYDVGRLTQREFTVWLRPGFAEVEIDEFGILSVRLLNADDAVEADAFFRVSPRTSSGAFNGAVALMADYAGTTKIWALAAKARTNQPTTGRQDK
jgi:hypothetical protein